MGARRRPQFLQIGHGSVLVLQESDLRLQHKCCRRVFVELTETHVVTFYRRMASNTKEACELTVSCLSLIVEALAQA